MVQKQLHQKFINIIWCCFMLAIILIMISMLFAKYNNEDKVISLKGYSIFKVATGSMIPTLNIGDYILVKTSNQYKVGDIVTYKSDNNYITHRIVEIQNNEIYTQGDANNTLDEPITLLDIKGKLVTKLTLFQLLYNKYFIGGFMIIVLAVNVWENNRKGKEYNDEST